MSSTASVLPPVPEYIRSLVPYVPGKPIEETQREFKIKKVIKLASNENPLGPGPKAVAALKRGLADLHRYPDAGAFALRKTLSEQLGVKPGQLLFGNGSNEVIDFLIRTYCVPGDRILTSQAAFIAYKICAQIHGVETTEVPLNEGLVFDPQDFLEAVKRDPRIRIVFIANPNNPTGTHVPDRELRALLGALQKRGVLVVLDYAYWEYVEAKDLSDPMRLLRDFPEVVILRTFSKIHGLAGLRVGYGVGAPETIANLEKVRQPFNLNSLGLLAAEASLRDTAFTRRARGANSIAKKFWMRGLDKLGIPYWPTQGNFILADVQKGLGKTGGEIFQASLARGVIFRPVTNYGLPGALRISMGNPEENRWALKVLGDMGSAKRVGATR